VSCFLSQEFWTDSGIELAPYLAERFAVRFERGVGPSMVSTLLAGTAGTVVAAGAAASGQTGISTLIGSDDLFHLISSLRDPAYFANRKCAWCMRPTTYYAIMSLRSNSSGQLIFPVMTDPDGYVLLLNKRVIFAPSMPALGSGGSSIILGDFSRFIVREAGDMLITVSVEVRPERGQLYVRGMWRLQSGCAIDPNVTPADQPFVTFSNVMQAETERSQPAKPEGGHHGGRTSRP
jgi:HK97 family phage major capsid protein